MTGHGTSKDEITSPRTRRAIAYGDKLAQIANHETDENWDALLPMIDPQRFVRRGNERNEEIDWPTYRAMLDAWAGSGETYKKQLYRASEAGSLVYLDLDERFVASDGQERKLRSISIYEFDDADRIVAVDICVGFHRAVETTG